MINSLSKFLKKTKRLLKDIAKPLAYVVYASYNYYSFRHPTAQKLPPTSIGEGTSIHPQAFVAERGVVIGKDCNVSAFAIILEHTALGDGVRIMEGSVIGSEGFVRLKVGKHITLRRFRGGVEIHDGAIVGSHTCVDRAMTKGNTVIGNGSIIGSNIHVAHDVQIGRSCEIGAGAMLAGFMKIENGSIIGYDSSISNDLTIGEEAMVYPGAVVTKDVAAKRTVSGNFAIDHSRHRLLMTENEYFMGDSTNETQ